MEEPQLTIILAEDDDGHATLIRRNLERSPVCVNIRRVHNGQELLEFVNAEIGNSLVARRALVLLDIAMPKVDGVEALKRLKSDPRTRPVPVYMLSTTNNPVEVSRCFEAGCNAYLTKPLSYQKFISAMDRLCAFIAVSELPAIGPPSENARA